MSKIFGAYFIMSLTFLVLLAMGIITVNGFTSYMVVKALAAGGIQMGACVGVGAVAAVVTHTGSK